MMMMTIVVPPLDCCSLFRQDPTIEADYIQADFHLTSTMGFASGASDGSMFGQSCASKCFSVAAMNWVRSICSHNPTLAVATAQSSLLAFEALQLLDPFTLFCSTKFEEAEVQ